MRLVGGESEVKRKRKSMHWEEKFGCFFFLYILLLSAQRKVLSGLQICDRIVGPLWIWMKFICVIDQRESGFGVTWVTESVTWGVWKSISTDKLTPVTCWFYEQVPWATDSSVHSSTSEHWGRMGVHYLKKKIKKMHLLSGNIVAVWLLYCSI